MKPLSDIRVLDLTNVLAGPFCCHQLAFMGADVIKIELPGKGDLARQLGADSELNDKLMGVSFLAQNSGKRSITVNLKSTTGKTIFKRLARSADVIVENFRPGVMERLGLGFDELKKECPELVYWAISGFGQDGPLRDFPAYDQIIQGMSGVMSITGDKDSAPLRVGYPMADTIGGMTAAFAISSALADRGNRKGCLIDVSMLESVIATMGWVVSSFLLAGKMPQPMGNDNFTASPSGTFSTADGLINIAANKQEQFEALCRIIDNPELVDDPRFSTRQSRLDNRQSLTEFLEAGLAAKTATEWHQILNAAGVPAGPVLNLDEVLSQPQISERGQVATFSNSPGIERDTRITRPGIRLNGKALETDSPPPQLGADTEQILVELGYSLMEIEQLKAEQAI